MNTSDQPTVPDGEPTAPAEDAADSYQTGRTYSAAEISRRIKRSRLQPTDATRNLAEQLLTAVTQYERDQAARRAAAGDENPYDLDPLAEVHDLARFYDATRDDPNARERFLDHTADDLDLTDVRALRTVGELAAAVTPRLVLAYADRGMKPPRIAEEIGLTPTRVYGIIREEREKRVNALVEYAVKRDAETGGDPRETLARFSAVRKYVPEEHREAVEQLLEKLRSAVAKQQAQQTDGE